MRSGWGNAADAPGSAAGQPDQGPAQPGQGPTEPGYPGQPAYPAAPPPNKRPSWLGAAIVGIIVALLVGGFFLFRDRLSNDVTSLAVGECFDTPAFDTEVAD